MTSEEKTLKLETDLSTAIDLAHHNYLLRRHREEAEYRGMQGWGVLLTEREYSLMNRRVSREMQTTPEYEALEAAQTAWRNMIAATLCKEAVQ